MIEIHADDYGLFVEQSERIIKCIDAGCVNGISIIPNSPRLEECVNLLGKRKPLLTIHLNFVEGKRLSIVKGKELISKQGIFREGLFGKLLFFSYIPILRRKYYDEIKSEMIAQIDNSIKYFENNDIRIDSHCHYHMLPIVFDALMDTINEKKMSVSYIRYPKENILTFLRLRKHLEHVRPINCVKVLVLNILAIRNALHQKTHKVKTEKKDFVGVLFSGKMNVRNSIPYFNFYSESPKDVEILFHPGAVKEADNILKLTNKDDVAFFTSRDRDAEGLATIIIKEKSECGK